MLIQEQLGQAGGGGGDKAQAIETTLDARMLISAHVGPCSYFYRNSLGGESYHGWYVHSYKLYLWCQLEDNQTSEGSPGLVKMANT